MKNQTFSQEFYPIRFGWLKTMPMLIFLAAIIYVWFAALKSAHLGPHLVAVGILGVLVTVFVCSVFQMFFSGIYVGDWKFLLNYLCKNVIGFEVWILKVGDGGPIFSIRPRGASLEKVLDGERGDGWMIRYSLGGWFPRRGRIVHCNDGTNLDYAGRVKTVDISDLDPLEHWLLVPDRLCIKGKPRLIEEAVVGDLFNWTPSFVQFGGINWRAHHEHGHKAFLEGNED